MIKPFYIIYQVQLILDLYFLFIHEAVQLLLSFFNIFSLVNLFLI